MSEVYDARVAQLVEHSTDTRKVLGSTPSTRTTYDMEEYPRLEKDPLSAFMGSCFLVLGFFILALVLGDLNIANGDAPEWVIVCAAGVSLFLGLAPLAPYVSSRPRFFQRTVGTCALIFLVLIIGYAAFGPSERHFAGSGLFGQSASELEGRILFGFTFFAFILIPLWYRFRKRK